MSQQLTLAELKAVIDGLEYAKSQTIRGLSQEQVDTVDGALAKLHTGLRHVENRATLSGTVEPERFPAVISLEEAHQYSDIGENMMLEAAQKVRVSEGVHHKLSCLMIGLVSALVRTMNVDREPFCNQCVANVMFTALKAAHAIPSAPQAEPADGYKE